MGGVPGAPAGQQWPDAPGTMPIQAWHNKAQKTGTGQAA